MRARRAWTVRRSGRGTGIAPVTGGCSAMCARGPAACTRGSGVLLRADAQDDAIVLKTYGRSSGYCVDPVEKKPLNHFLPGSAVLSSGTAGCNLGCRFCQNWDISKSRETDTLADAAAPAAIARAAARLGCRAVAFTCNDPVIFLEYAIDVAGACRQAGIKAVAVTAGYMCAQPRAEFFGHIDAANVDLKGSPATSVGGPAWPAWTRCWRPCCTCGTRPVCGWRSPTC